jgi:acyl-CoA thioesterase-1
MALSTFLAAGLLAPAAAAEKPIKIVALGDSLSAGYQLPMSAAFPAQLEKA